MAKEKRFPIGAVARMFGVSVGTLRHYERLGLLAPAWVDPDSGYRYYGPAQFEALNTIRYLRALDMPLTEIGAFVRSRDLDTIEDMLRRQKTAVVQKQQELARIQRRIENRLERLHQARTAPRDQIRLCQLPACRMVQLLDTVQPRSYLDLEYAIRRLEAGQADPAIFLGKVGVGITAAHLAAGRLDRYDLVFLLLDEEEQHTGPIQQLPAGPGVSVCFCGSHKEAPAYYEKLMAFIRARGLAPAGASREITLIDDGLTRDPDQFVTEISIPVTPG